MSSSINKSVIKKTNNRGLINNNGHSNDIPSQKIKFESSDSQGSDISYESSIGSDEDIQLGRVQYFKQEMARFFINYPELINEDIIDKQKENFLLQEQTKSKTQMVSPKKKVTDVLSQKQKEQQMKYIYATKHHWGPIAHDIIKQAKQSSTSLEAIAKRITLYRNKVDQQDIIDILLKQQSFILKEIEEQIKEKKFESNQGRINFAHDRISKQSSSVNGGDTVFYSWKKQRQAQLKKMNNSVQKQMKRNDSAHKNIDVISKQKQIHRSLSKTTYKSNSKSTKKQTGKNNQPTKAMKSYKVDQQTNKQAISNSLIRKPNLLKSKSIYQSNQPNLINKATSVQSIPNPTQNKHILNFEPKTEAGKQLYEEIKRHNPNDDLNIKKTIITFLSKHRQTMQKQIVNKSTLSQKINKLYSEDSKQLVMFYPAGRNQVNQHKQRQKAGIIHGTGMSSTAGNYSDFSTSVETDAIMNVLKQICEGPLMKYWKQLQQKKL